MDIYVYPRKKNIIIHIKDARNAKEQKTAILYVQRIET